PAGAGPRSRGAGARAGRRGRGGGDADLPQLATRAAGGALAYVDAVYRRRPAHLRPPEPYTLAGFLAVDAATRRNLELLETLRGERRGSLPWGLDQTRTPLGGRRVGGWGRGPPPRPRPHGGAAPPGPTP